jgi:hypothetical protein
VYLLNWFFRKFHDEISLHHQLVVRTVRFEGSTTTFNATDNDESEEQSNNLLIAA